MWGRELAQGAKSAGAFRGEAPSSESTHHRSGVQRGSRKWADGWESKQVRTVFRGDDVESQDLAVVVQVVAGRTWGPGSSVLSPPAQADGPQNVGGDRYLPRCRAATEGRGKRNAGGEQLILDDKTLISGLTPGPRYSEGESLCLAGWERKKIIKIKKDGVPLSFTCAQCRCSIPPETLDFNKT